jgi:hypothetical protein
MRKVLLHGKCKGGLYPLPPSTSRFQKLVFSAIKISVDRWHSQLGHPSRDIVCHVSSRNNLSCTHFDSSCEYVCDACACAKAHQLPFPVSSSCSSAPLQLVFSDVWGLDIDSFGNKKCIVSFIEDYCKVTWIYLLRHKYEVSKYFLEFRSLLNGCLRKRSSPCNMIGVVNMSVFSSIFVLMASPTSCHVPTHTNKMGPSNASITTSWRWVLLSSLVHPCH